MQGHMPLGHSAVQCRVVGVIQLGAVGRSQGRWTMCVTCQVSGNRCQVSRATVTATVTVTAAAVTGVGRRSLRRRFRLHSHYVGCCHKCWSVGTLDTLCMYIRVFFEQETESCVLNIQFKTIGFLSVGENNRVLSDLNICL